MLASSLYAQTPIEAVIIDWLGEVGGMMQIFLESFGDLGFFNGKLPYVM